MDLALGVWSELGTLILLTLPMLRTKVETLFMAKELAASERGRFPQIPILGRLSSLATVSAPCIFRLTGLPKSGDDE